MTRRLLLLGFLVGAILPAWAQDTLDLTKVLADPKTFVFSNNRNTVKGYIYDQLESKTTCCGEVRMYLEVRIDPTGYVLSVKPLTGKDKECYANSAIDIVKNIRWDASDFRAPKSVYLEIKPELDCEGRADQYQPLPLFNNELFDENGNRIEGAVATTPLPGQETKTQEKPASTPPATTQPKQEKAVATTQPKQEEKAKQPATTPPPAEKPAETQQQPVAAAPAQADQEKPKMTPEEQKESEEEIAMLREKLAELRAEEEIRMAEQRERMLALQRQRQEQEARDKAMAEDPYAADYGSSESDESYSGGGLFLDDSPGGESESYGEAETGATSDPAMMSEEERLREEIARLEQRRQELMDAQRAREDEARRIMQERQQANQDLIALEEEIADKSEAMTQVREEEELRRMEEDRQRVADDRQRIQDEYQRLMDEIQRLQQEADAKIADLERMQGDIDDLNQQKQAREQEIALNRQLRQTQQEAELERRRLELSSQGGFVASNDPGSMGTVPNNILTASDSDKYVYLLGQINQLNMELQRLREYIALSGGTPPSGTATASQGGTSSQTSPGTSSQASSGANGMYKSAAQEKSWKDINYKAPGVAEEKYVSPVQGQKSTPSSGGQQAGQDGSVPPSTKYEPGKGYSPAPSHKKTHANVPGIKFSEPQTAAGQAAMKDHLKEELRKGGVCGLAQAAFELTINGEGKVIGNRVLASNTDLVRMQLGTILPGLKFQPTGSRIPERVYMDFKAEIICPGVENDVELGNVPDLINK